MIERSLKGGIKVTRDLQSSYPYLLMRMMRNLECYFMLFTFLQLKFIKNLPSVRKMYTNSTALRHVVRNRRGLQDRKNVERNLIGLYHRLSWIVQCGA